MTRLEWIRTNNVALNIQLTNWVYRTSDKFQLIVKQASRGTGEWPGIFGTAIWTSGVPIYMQYNYYGGRSVMNFGHAGAWSGDSTLSYNSVDDFTNFFMFEVDGSTFTIYKSENLNGEYTQVATVTTGTTSDTDTTSPYLYIEQSPYAPDHYFYELKVYRNNDLIHDYVPISGGVGDIVDNTEYHTSKTGYIDGPTAVPSYSVAYNANGGEGSMAVQSIEIDVPTALSANTFTNGENMFIGWSTTAGGQVEYTDGQIVTNLGEEGETITLYAVWDAAFGIDIQHNLSETNRVTKELETILHVAGKLREETSIIDPTFLIECDLEDVVGANYLTVPAFGRSYFIKNITSYSTDLVQFNCHVDVLSSFADEIKANKGIVFRSEQRGVWNLYIDDGSLVSYQNPYILTEPFPNGFTGASFILAVAGSA